MITFNTQFIARSSGVLHTTYTIEARGRSFALVSSVGVTIATRTTETELRSYAKRMSLRIETNN